MRTEVHGKQRVLNGKIFRVLALQKQHVHWQVRGEPLCEHSQSSALLPSLCHCEKHKLGIALRLKTGDRRVITVVFGSLIRQAKSSVVTETHADAQQQKTQDKAEHQARRATEKAAMLTPLLSLCGR